MAEINKAEVMDALRECYDPEIPVNIVDLGLVYKVDTNDETGRVDGEFALTPLSVFDTARDSVAANDRI